MRLKRKKIRTRLLLSSIVFYSQVGHKQRNLTLLCPLIVFHSQVSILGYFNEPKTISEAHTEAAICNLHKDSNNDEVSSEG